MKHELEKWKCYNKPEDMSRAVKSNYKILKMSKKATATKTTYYSGTQAISSVNKIGLL